jgi:hypothetical protein
MIIPPRRPEHGSDYVSRSVYQVMTRFAREGEEHPDWWDWYVIGGRRSGEHIRAGLPEDKLKEFCEELERRNVTVSVHRFGKEELIPKKQEASVDALWREFFPGAGDKCLLFRHSDSQWSDSGEESVDVMPVGQLPKGLSAHTLIVAGPDWSDKHKLRAHFMLHKKVWNGCNLQATDWDGNVLKGIELANEDHYVKKSVTAEWLAVTVDYHHRTDYDRLYKILQDLNP